MNKRPQRLADAVAVAGLEVAAQKRPRAVVLVLGPHVRDASEFKAAEVREYLRQVGVPLEVWSTTETPRTTAWGEQRDISNLPRLARAVNELRGELDRQATELSVRPGTTAAPREGFQVAEF